MFVCLRVHRHVIMFTYVSFVLRICVYIYSEWTRRAPFALDDAEDDDEELIYWISRRHISGHDIDELQLWWERSTPQAIPDDVDDEIDICKQIYTSIGIYAYTCETPNYIRTYLRMDACTVARLHASLITGYLFHLITQPHPRLKASQNWRINRGRRQRR